MTYEKVKEGKREMFLFSFSLSSIIWDDYDNDG